MRLLLDTHAFLWAAGAPSELSEPARAAIGDRANDVFLSAAVSWEIASKTASGKLRLPMDPSAYVRSRMQAYGFIALPITHDHALAVSGLPRIHADPFDRIMIAQAQTEAMTLVTRDAATLGYPVRTLLA